MSKVSKNLGLVSAIHVGTSQPSNIYQLWYNLSDGKHYYYNVDSEIWVALITDVSLLNIEKIFDKNQLINSFASPLIVLSAVSNKFIRVENFKARYKFDTNPITIDSGTNNFRIFSGSSSLGNLGSVTVNSDIEFHCIISGEVRKNEEISIQPIFNNITGGGGTNTQLIVNMQYRLLD